MIRRISTALCCLLLIQLPIQAGTIDTVIGTGRPDNNGARGPADSLNVGQPFGVELGPDGALYVTEVQNHRVLRLDLKTQQLTTVAGNGTAGYSGDGGPATSAQLHEPYEVRFDRQGNMFFVEMKNHLVRRVDARTGKISTVAGSGTAGYSGDGGLAVKAQLRVPHSIALDDRNGLYIADIGNHRIRKVDLKSGLIHSIAGSTERSLPQDGQLAAGNPILGPRALCFHQGTLWIALREGHSVWKLPLKEGTLQHVAGDGSKGYSGDGGAARSARFNGPKGICIGPAGKIFVVDTENHAIRRIDPVNDRIETVAGSGERGAGGDGGAANAAQLDRPHGICVGPNGTIYIGDTVNHRVRRVKP